MGFVVNPYDPCIANKIVDGHKSTLQSRVDDLIISHIDMSAINDFLWELKVIYGDSLAESTGKQHNYLGIIFDFSSKNEVQINMNLSSSLGGAKNYRYQRYFVPYKICIVSFHSKTTMFLWHQ